jgi:hypothetical protein
MFGHADCPDSIMPRIEAAIEVQYMIHGVCNFYVGNRGRFDSLVAMAAKRVKQRHPDLKLYLVLAYHPGERSVDLTDGFDNSFYPTLEGVPRQYAIVRANKYMVDTADTIICYVKHIGNTRNLLEYAQRRQKKEGIIIENVAEDF